MINKLKAHLTSILGFITLILGALFLSQKRRAERAESQLAGALTNTEIKLNDQAREAAKENADALVEAYEQLKRDR